MKILMFPRDSKLGFPHGRWRRTASGIVVRLDMTALEQEVWVMMLEALMKEGQDA